jgi:hypothetical protein
MTYDTDETSSSQSRPRNLYVIVTPTELYRHTSHPVDVVYAGNTYTALTMDSGALEVTSDPTGRELIVQLPIMHPLVQRYFASGIPPHGVVVTFLRMQEISGVAVQQSSGFAQSMAVDGHVATIRVPSVIDDAIKIMLPVVRAQKTCNHVLFDARCTPGPGGIDGPDPDAFSFPANIVSQIGRTLVISTTGSRPDSWAKFGRVVHVGSAQTRTITEQIGATLTLIDPLVNVANGSGIIVYAGCGHTLDVCKSKFSNVMNFGGHPHLNSAVNPYSPGGLGIIRQV